jgi:hypothetical protein
MELIPVASQDQKIVNGDGEKIIVSQRRHYVQFYPYSEFSHIAGNKIMFMMYIQNNGEAPVDIGYDDISVVFQETSPEGKSYEIDILTSNEFIEEFRKEVAEFEFRAFKSASNDILERYRTAADHIHSSHSMNGNISREQISADYKEKRDEFHKEMEALADESDRVREQNRKFLDRLQQTVMKLHTVLPGKGSRRLVAWDTGSMKKDKEGSFMIVVSVDGEKHKFTFNRSVNKSGG